MNIKFNINDPIKYLYYSLFNLSFIGPVRKQKTRTKVIQESISQGCNKVKRFQGKKIKKLTLCINKKKMTLNDLWGYISLIKKTCLFIMLAFIEFLTKIG